MPSFENFENIEFDQLVGDQLVTMGHSHAELLSQGPIELTIDGHKVRIPRVKAGYDAVGKVIGSRLTTIYDAANQLYGEQLHQENPIPLLCHREHMTPVGACRVCVVELKGAPRLAPACQRAIEPGMEVSTILTSAKVQSTVKTIVEMLATDHDRPIDGAQKGEKNELQVIADRLGARHSRFPKPAADRGRDDSSLVIAVDHNSCILCDRCIRACNEVRHNEVIGRMGKGYSARIAFDLNDPMGNSSCVACGECMISCPTGALTNRAAVGTDMTKADLAGGEAVTADDLAQHPLFAGISAPFLRWNQGAVVRKHYKKGDIVCREGDFGSTAFIMEKGRFEVRIRSSVGHVKLQKGSRFGVLGRFVAGFVGRDKDDRDDESEARFIPVDAPVSLDYGNPVAVLEPKDILFGEMTCMSQYPRSATVTALEDCTVLEILRNVLYMLQRNRASKALLDDVYRRRALETHLLSVKIFAGLTRDPAELSRFVEFLRPKVQLVRVHPGQVIFRQDDPADHFYMVRAGFVKVAQSRQGTEQVLSYVGPGGYFGEIGLLSNIPEIATAAPRGVRIATCSALDHVDLVRVPGEVFLELLEQFPEVRRQIVEVALKRLAENELARQEVEKVSLGEFLGQGLVNAQSLLVIDLLKCTRCDECTKACSDAHGGVTRLIRDGLRFDRFLVASSCRSCLDPYCLVGCPVGAIRRRGNREIIIEDWCIGCGKCAENCPYGNINMHGMPTDEETPDLRNPGKWLPVVQQKATTCDLCRELKDGQPSCVYACPHDAAHRVGGQELLEWIRTSNP